MNGDGSDFADEYQGKIKKIPVANTIGNEPFKNLSYMKEKGKSYIDALNNGEEWMNKPIVAIVHPYNSSKYVVVDGNHRLFAHKETNNSEVNAIIVPHKDVVLMKNEWGNENQESINLTDVLDDKEIVDMYFVKPDGTNNFQSEEIKGGLHDTSWQNEKGDKITLIDLLNATEEIPVQKISVEELRPYLLSWDDDPEEIKKIEKADLQYPILIFVTSNGEFLSIIDGHHRAQKAARKGLETIKAKVINIDTLPKKIRKVFSHLGNQEEMTEGEITERCWKGYTQKGMKTMFGKRYPNCVKKTK